MSAQATAGIRSRFAAELLNSDEEYFELAAERVRLEGCTLVWMPGLTELAAGCVVHRVEPDRIRDPRALLGAIERAVQEKGSRLVRIYLQQPVSAFEAALAAAGYQRRVEIALLTPPQIPPLNGLSVREVKTPADWCEKQAIHREIDSEPGPDDYPNPAELWVELVRRKCESGRKRTYFIERAGEICGVVGTLETENILRLKNLIVHPDHRNSGLGMATVNHFWRVAMESGKRSLGLFALEGKRPLRMYERVGCVPCGSQIEWSKDFRNDQRTEPHSAPRASASG